ncbi:unnamed protein product [Closterium sp. Naga37s-1]|nr:unnamed protein product [Closterium sp. Naga37s-1]
MSIAPLQSSLFESHIAACSTPYPFPKYQLHPLNVSGAARVNVRSARVNAFLLGSTPFCSGQRRSAAVKATSKDKYPSDPPLLSAPHPRVSHAFASHVCSPAQQHTQLLGTSFDGCADLPPACADVAAAFANIPDACADDIAACADDIAACADDIGAFADDIGAFANDIGAFANDIGAFANDIAACADDIAAFTDDVPGAFASVPGAFASAPGAFASAPDAFAIVALDSHALDAHAASCRAAGRASLAAPTACHTRLARDQMSTSTSSLSELRLFAASANSHLDALRTALAACSTPQGSPGALAVLCSPLHAAAAERTVTMTGGPLRGPPLNSKLLRGLFFALPSSSQGLPLEEEAGVSATRVAAAGGGGDAAVCAAAAGVAGHGLLHSTPRSFCRCADCHCHWRIEGLAALCKVPSGGGGGVGVGGGGGGGGGGVAVGVWVSVKPGFQ